MKKKVLILAMVAALGLTNLITFGKDKPKKPTTSIEVGDLCCTNFDGWCNYGDVIINGAFWYPH
ncbi:MAG: hypothetical protein PHE03_13420 [Bacteroidales bacterium]|nr:hypothetical protein [Bacteroidales bacterium]MDD3893292.1 hypothetical protein [Bacteroidales bacterium]